ncbi:MAG: cupin domain-containing protein [Desulfobacterales bacterium]|nr:cupin domain-containing protein [Desulfobacterales bacterium]MDD4072481.1 cupin domain-containing protein [Desulfobacterales bacterium]MDD4392566.1 cupin domain-containing protein [Desulfobacterales bacterium]
MKIIHYSEAESRSFNNETVKGVTGRVLIGKADGALNFCMRVFELSPDGYTPGHCHEWEHEIFFHSGKGQIVCEGSTIPVSEGYTAFIAGNETHQIKNTGTKPLIFACLIPSGAPEL